MTRAAKANLDRTCGAWQGCRQEESMPNMSKFISSKTAALIVREDMRLNAKECYRADFLNENVTNLLRFGRVEIGWREACGTTDRTQVRARSWFRVLQSLKKDGIDISEVPVKHNCSWATKAGGFWKSIIYVTDILPHPDSETQR